MAANCTKRSNTTFVRFWKVTNSNRKARNYSFYPFYFRAFTKCVAAIMQSHDAPTGPLQLVSLGRLG